MNIIFHPIPICSKNFEIKFLSDISGQTVKILIAVSLALCSLIALWNLGLFNFFKNKKVIIVSNEDKKNVDQKSDILRSKHQPKIYKNKSNKKVAPVLSNKSVNQNKKSEIPQSQSNPLLKTPCDQQDILPTDLIGLIISYLRPVRPLGSKGPPLSKICFKDFKNAKLVNRNWYNAAERSVARMTWLNREAPSLKKLGLVTAQQAVNYLINQRKNCNKVLSANFIDFPDLTDNLMIELLRNCKEINQIFIKSNYITQETANVIRSLDKLEVLHIEALIKILDLSCCTKLKEISTNNCTSVTNIHLPNRARKLQWLEMNGCNNATSIKLPRLAPQLKKLDMKNCTSVMKIQLPDQVNELELIDMENCSSTMTIQLPKEVPKLKELIMNRCNNATLIQLPEEAPKLYMILMNDCSNVLSIRLPEQALQLRRVEMNRCSQVETIILSKNMVKLVLLSIVNCINLGSIKLPNHLPELEELDLSYCSSLVTIQLPNLIPRLKKLKIRDCLSLTHLELPKQTPLLSQLDLDNCSSLSHIKLPDQASLLKEINFHNCKNIDIHKKIQKLAEKSKKPFQRA